MISIGILFCFSALAHAEKIQYFESKIDFWGEKEAKKSVSLSPAISTEKSEEKFPWKTYLDPKNKEFFKEGDYTPPEPFMEVARNPTDENLKQWFELMKKKNELQARLQIRMQEYMAKNSTSQNLPEVMTKSAPSPPPVREQAMVLDPQRFKIRMYFESTCPHCRRMFSVLKRLQESGVQVEALQIDTGPMPEEEKIVPIARADPTDLKKHRINGVPFLLIADIKQKALLPAVEGYHDFEEILRLLKSASRS